MSKLFRRIIGLSLLSAIFVNLIACGSESKPVIKIALLPILDGLPAYVAQEKGYFDEVNVQVEFVPVNSAPERDTLLQTDQVDGALTDLSSVAIFNRDSSVLKIVGKARRPFPDAPHFQIIAAPDFEANEPLDLAQIPIGISNNTIIEYITDRILVEWGLPLDKIASEEVPAIPIRFELLMQGELKAATLPEPLGTAAVAAGASVIVSDTEFSDYSQSVIAFRSASISQNEDGIRRFMQAWNRAVEDINSDPSSYLSTLVENTPVPPPIQSTYQIPPFPKNEITTQEEWDDIMRWMLEKDLIDSSISFDSSVDGQFLE